MNVPSVLAVITYFEFMKNCVDDAKEVELHAAAGECICL